MQHCPLLLCDQWHHTENYIMQAGKQAASIQKNHPSQVTQSPFLKAHNGRCGQPIWSGINRRQHCGGCLQVFSFCPIFGWHSPWPSGGRPTPTPTPWRPDLRGKIPTPHTSRDQPQEGTELDLLLHLLERFEGVPTQGKKRSTPSRGCGRRQCIAWKGRHWTWGIKEAPRHGSERLLRSWHHGVGVNKGLHWMEPRMDYLFETPERWENGKEIWGPPLRWGGGAPHPLICLFYVFISRLSHEEF